MNDAQYSPEGFDPKTPADMESAHHQEASRQDHSEGAAAQHTSKYMPGNKGNLREHAEYVRDDVTNRAKEIGRKGRGALTQKIMHCEKAVHAAADQLREDGEEDIADYIDVFASNCNNANNYLNDCSVDRVVNDISRQVSKHPALFFGGLFIAGFALTRFLKATEPQPEDPHEYDPHEGPSHGYGADPSGNGHRYPNY